MIVSQSLSHASQLHGINGFIIASANLFQQQCLPTLTSRKYPDVSPLDISHNYSLGIRFKLYFVQYVWETFAREKILLRAGATNFQQSNWRNSVINPIFCGRFSCISETQLVVLARLLYPIRVPQSAIQVYICQKYICYIC